MSGYLTHSVSSTGNRKIFTISAWVKVNANTVNQTIFGAGTAGSNSGKFYFAISNGQVRIGGGANVYIVSTTVLRDPASWYHLVCAVDTSQATSSNRIKLYINGVQETDLTTTNYTSQDQNTPVNESGKINTFGAEQGGGESWDGCMTHMVLVDGAQLTPSNFGETDSTTGEWKPKADPTGVTYGTNGVFMKCENSGNFGLDSSGQGNNYTANSFPTGAFSIDSASNNFCTMNPLDVGSDLRDNGSFANCNLEVTNGATSGQADQQRVRGTIAVTQGKWYFEMKLLANSASIGLLATEAAHGGTSANSMLVEYTTGGEIRFYNGSGRTTLSTGINTYTDDDIVGCALDMDNRRAYFHKNGVYQGDPTPDPASSPSGAGQHAAILSDYTMAPCMFDNSSGSAGRGSFNFGNPAFSISSGNSDGNGYGNFEYAVPSGYYALCTKNLNTYG